MIIPRTKVVSIIMALLLTWTSITTRAQASDNGFIAPSAPTPSARPSAKLPQQGRDKHGMPFYHDDQNNRVVRTTAYTHTESDHVGYGRKNAIGSRLLYGKIRRSAAADWSVYPVGTEFKIKGQPYIYVIDDYGGALVGTGTIDLYQPSKRLMRKWGRRNIEIMVIKWGNPQRSIKTLAGRTRYRHCATMQAALIKKENARKKENI